MVLRGIGRCEVRLLAGRAQRLRRCALAVAAPGARRMVKSEAEPSADASL